MSSVENFRAFLRIPTVSHSAVNGAYYDAIDFLRSTYEHRLDGCVVEVFEIVDQRPICLFKLPGEKPELKSIILNCHTDVVPVCEDKWERPPFAAEMDDDGNIYARGTQDMKCVGIQYLEALCNLYENGKRFERTIYVIFVPDEEIGGETGMAPFVETTKFADLHAAVVLDEGLANPTEKYTVFYGERAPIWFRLQAKGPTGHASRFVKGTAMERLLNVINRLYVFRREQEMLLEGTCGCNHAVAKKLGDVTTVNCTMLNSGVSADGGKTFCLNVIPTEAEAGFDVRVATDFDLDSFLSMLKEWAKEEEVEVHIQSMPKAHAITSLENKWWSVFSNCCTSLNLEIEAEIFPAATDSRFIRRLGIPAFGFSPMNKTPILLHDHNEMLNKDVFLHGIKIYEALITSLANFSEEEEDVYLDHSSTFQIQTSASCFSELKQTGIVSAVYYTTRDT